MTTTMGAPAAADWRFPRAAAGVAVLLEAGRDAGVPVARMLAGTELDVAGLAEVDAVVTAEQELRVVRNLRAAAPRVTGASVGERYHATSFGVLGFALLSSATVGEAMGLALRYLDLSFSFATPTAELDGDEVVVRLGGDRLPADVRDFLLDRDRTAIHAVLGELHPGPLPVRRTGPALLAYDAALLDVPLPQANAQTRALSEALCRDVVSRRRERRGVAEEVRVLVTQRLARGAAMTDVAADLGLSVRTLRRRLVDAGTTYQTLTDEVRETLATELLVAGMRVEDVALRLGYAEAASLIHAFRRWTGTTPTTWLRQDAGRGRTEQPSLPRPVGRPRARPAPRRGGPAAR